jgi:hypothetical protein
MIVKTPWVKDRENPHMIAADAVMRTAPNLGLAEAATAHLG